MNQEQHDEEIREQAKAEVGAGRVVPGSGRRGKPRRMAQMVSVRLDGELVGKLRIVAKERNVTFSDLLREGAELIVDDEYTRAQTRTDFTISGAQRALHETMSERTLVAH
jgi:predicted transcriptional regulator